MSPSRRGFFNPEPLIVLVIVGILLGLLILKGAELRAAGHQVAGWAVVLVPGVVLVVVFGRWVLWLHQSEGWSGVGGGLIAIAVLLGLVLGLASLCAAG